MNDAFNHLLFEMVDFDFAILLVEALHLGSNAVYLVDHVGKPVEGLVDSAV